MKKLHALLWFLSAVSVVAAGASSSGEPAAGLPESGYVQAVPGRIATAMVIADSKRSDTGELYLWHTGTSSLRHIKLDGKVFLRGIEWSPNGLQLAFFVDGYGGRTLWCTSTDPVPGRIAYQVGGPNVTYKVWSPDSQNLAFIEETKSGPRLRCALGALQAFDLPVPGKLAVRLLHWHPLSNAILAAAWTEGPGREDGPESVSKPALFVTYPSTARKAKILWQDPKLKGIYPRSRWADGGRKVTYALVATGAYDIPQSLHVVNPDGSGARTLWKKSFTEFVVYGKTALLWLLPDPGRTGASCPEPDRMAAINIGTGKTRLYRKDMVAVEPGLVSPVRQQLRWSSDGHRVSLMTREAQPPFTYHRVTLDLP